MTPDCTSRECLIAVLIQLNKRLGKFDAPSELFITLLSAYRGTLASCDMWIKDALKTAELQGIWSLTQHITQTEAVLSLHGVSEPATGPRVLAVLDPDAVYASCIACTSAELGSEHKHVYDPEFILGLLAAFIGGGAIEVQDFMLLVRANVLGVPITGLSSSNPSIRQASDRILARLRVRLQVRQSLHVAGRQMADFVRTECGVYGKRGVNAGAAARTANGGFRGSEQHFVDVLGPVLSLFGNAGRRPLSSALKTSFAAVYNRLH